MLNKNNVTGMYNNLQLLQAYEQAIDENIISSITDTEGIIVHANQKFCDVSKFSINEILGHSHSIVNSGYHNSEFFSQMWKTISSGVVWHKEVKNKAKDGSFYWVDTVIVPVKEKDGTISHYLSLRTLITERKYLEVKKAKYVDSLESILVMTSINVKNPLALCLQQINAFNPDRQMDKKELQQIMSELKESVSELDSFTRELSTFIRDLVL